MVQAVAEDHGVSGKSIMSVVASVSFWLGHSFFKFSLLNFLISLIYFIF